jgi:hypothetical protein
MESAIRPTDGCPGRIGQVGMIAALRGVMPPEVGKLVLVRHPVGLQPDPRQRGGEAFHWQVLALGAEVMLNGKACRNLVVPDDCLSPVSQVDPRQVERLVKKQARMDFDAAAADLARYLNKHPMTGEELEACIERAGEMTVFEHILQVVPVATALAELGFVPCGGGGTWDWSTPYLATTLTISANPDLFQRWQLIGTCKTSKQAMWDERFLAARESRGKVASMVLGFWRSAFGASAPVPPTLSAGEMYDRHQRDLRRLSLDSPPKLWVDGKTLRATRRVLAERYGLGLGEVGPLPDVPMALSFDERLLHIEVQGGRYAVQARGIWVEDCRISMREFLAISPQRLRGQEVRLEQFGLALEFNRQAVSSLG